MTADGPVAAARGDVAIEATLPDHPRSAARARRCVDSIESHCHPETAAKARLLITEMVAATIGDEDQRDIQVRMSVTGGVVRGEVMTERLLARRPQGWALLLVRRIATRWGMSGGVVWFELEDHRT